MSKKLRNDMFKAIHSAAAGGKIEEEEYGEDPAEEAKETPEEEAAEEHGEEGHKKPKAKKTKRGVSLNSTKGMHKGRSA